MRRGWLLLGLSLLACLQLSSEVCLTDEEFAEVETTLSEAADEIANSKKEIGTLRNLLDDTKMQSAEKEKLSNEQIESLQVQLKASIEASESLRERERFWLMLSGALATIATLAILIR